METLNLGVISCGVMGSDLARNLITLPQARLVAVCDVVESAAQKLAHELQVPYDLDHRALLDRPDLDAVCIASPGFLHRPMVADAAAAGKQIFCEKPLSITLADCKAMIAAAKTARVKLMVGHVLRYYPLHRKIKELVSSGELGAPLCLSIHRLGGGWAGSSLQRWRNQRARCGGLLLEINVHEIDFLRWVGGEVVRVHAVGKNFASPDLDYEDVMTLTLQFQNGAIGTLHTSIASALNSYGGRLDLAGGTIAFPHLWSDKTLTVRKLGEKENHTVEPANAHGLSPIQQELSGFIDAILIDREPPIPGEEGLAAVAIAEAAYQSIATGNPVCLP